MDASEITRPRWKNCAEASNIHITLDLQIGSNAMVMGDDSELREVLVNMVFNAIDAMPEGGTLSLTTRTVDESVVIKVIDTGVGMYPEVRSRIFDPFFTTKGKAGLGWAGGQFRNHPASRRQHRSRIAVWQRTEFRITLPLAKIARRASSQLRQTKQSLRLKLCLRSQSMKNRAPNCSWLMTKTSSENCLGEILEGEHCDVYLAESGSEALSLFQGDGV